MKIGFKKSHILIYILLGIFFCLTRTSYAQTVEADHGSSRTTITDSILTGTIDTSQLSKNPPFTVRFAKGAGKYALDEGSESRYKRSVKLSKYYEAFGTDYVAPWKLIPTGKGDVVEAYAIGSGAPFERGKLRFALKDGTEIPAGDEGGKWTLTLPGVGKGETYEVFALYETAKDKYATVGKLNVVSYPEQRHTVTLVEVDGQAPQAASLQDQLNGIYNSHGIHFTVQTDNILRGDTSWDLDGDGKLDVGGSGFFTTETAEMKALRQLYRDTPGSRYDKNGYYLFAVKAADASGEPDESQAVQGDMPRGKQFGYLFTSSAGDIGRLAAHELGHGIFTLPHTFDVNLLGSDSKGQTANLMDYGDGVELAVWQWNVMANPAPMTWFDDDEDAMLLDMGTDKIWIKWTETNKTPKRFLNKKHLFYTHRGVQRDGDDCSNSIYYKMTEGYIIRMYEECNSPEQIKKSELIFPGQKPYPLYLSDFEEDRLGEELISLIEQGGVEMAIILGRYALPVEDGYILITGEDFDQNDADRIVAGGFFVLEFVQVGKIIRFVKGAKILSGSGQAVNVTKRVIKTGAKQISQESAMNISVQFFINFVTEALSTPKANGADIATKAFADIDFASSIWSGVFSYTTLSKGEQTSFDCAYSFIKSFDEKGISFSGLTAGGLGCVITLGTRSSLKYLRNTQAVKELAQALSDAGKYDGIIAKLSEIISEDAIFEFIEVLTEYGINKGTEPLWIKE